MTEDELIERIKQEAFSKTYRRSSKGNFLSYGTIDGIKIGLPMAFKKPPYETAAINEKDLELAVTAKANGKIDKAFVLTVEYPKEVTFGGKQIVTNVADAELIYDRLKDVTPRQGTFGEFWTLPNFGDEEEPF
jgi:hypothetical protein